MTVFGFAVVHAVWISDIWFNIVPMVVSGGVCGLCIVWSYQHAVDRHTPGRWLAYNTGGAALLMALGGASLLVFVPRFTMAEVLAADDPLGLLMPPALPLIAAGTLAGTLILWVLFSRSKSALPSILVTQSLLMFLIGHNLAVLGLVEVSFDQWYRVRSLFGLTGFLAATFAASTLALTWARSTSWRSRQALRQSTARRRCLHDSATDRLATGSPVGLLLPERDQPTGADGGP
ncbi:MAG: hypothetical protein R6X29_10510 [Acidimicrobiia bacterium]